jgi:hypothetical protein
MLDSIGDAHLCHVHLLSEPLSPNERKALVQEFTEAKKSMFNAIGAFLKEYNNCAEDERPDRTVLDEAAVDWYKCDLLARSANDHPDRHNEARDCRKEAEDVLWDTVASTILAA